MDLTDLLKNSGTLARNVANANLLSKVSQRHKQDPALFVVPTREPFSSSETLIAMTLSSQSDRQLIFIPSKAPCASGFRCIFFGDDESTGMIFG